MRTILLASTILLATACAASAVDRCAVFHVHNRACGSNLHPAPQNGD